MRYYVIRTEDYQNLGCEFTRKEAFARAAAWGYKPSEVFLEPMDIDVTAENIRKMLGGEGGYASIPD